MIHKIAVVVGHYPDEPKKETEYENNLKVATLLHGLLVLNGFQAEIFEGHLNQKIEKVNKYGADIALECHFNYLHNPPRPDEYGSGLEVLCWPGSVYGKVLAARLIENLELKLPINRRGKTGLVERRDLVFLKHTKMPAVISEPLFLDNPFERAYLKMKRGHEFIAVALFNGITDYFRELTKPKTTV